MLAFPYFKGNLARILLELLGLLELDPEIQQKHGRDDTETQHDPPRGAQVLVGADDDHQVWDESSNDEAPIDHDVGEQDEPAIPRATLQLPTRFGTRNRACRVLPPDPHADEEPIGRESREHALKAPLVSIGGSAEGGEEGQDDGGNQEGVLARPLVAGVAEDQLAEDGAGEGDGRDVLLGARPGVGITIDGAEEGGDGPDDLAESQYTKWVVLLLSLLGRDSRY